MTRIMDKYNTDDDVLLSALGDNIPPYVIRLRDKRGRKTTSHPVIGIYADNAHTRAIKPQCHRLTHIYVRERAAHGHEWAHEK